LTKRDQPEIEINGDRVVIAGQAFPLSFRRDGRARRMLLRVMPADGAVLLVLPRFATRRAAESFLTEHAGWVLARQAERLPKAAWVDGAILTFEGRPHRIRHRPEERGRGAVWIEQDTVNIGGRAEHLPRRLRDWLKKSAQERFTQEARRMAEEIGGNVARVTVRDTRSRWGSCTSQGHLSFSWRVVLAPDFVQRYLIAHEVAHLKHMNHGPAFWRLAAQLSGGEAAMREGKLWLRRHGAALHQQG